MGNARSRVKKATGADVPQSPEPAPEAEAAVAEAEATTPAAADGERVTHITLTRSDRQSAGGKFVYELKTAPLKVFVYSAVDVGPTFDWPVPGEWDH